MTAATTQSSDVPAEPNADVASTTTRQPLTRTEWVALVVVVGLGALLRIWWALYAHPHPVSDYSDFYKLGLSIRHWNFLPGGPNDLFAFRSPGYPAVLAIGMLPSTAVPWIRMFNVGLSTAAIPLAFFVARRLDLGAFAATLGALAVALYPQFIFYSPVVASEHVQVIALLAMMLVLLSRMRSRAIVGGVLLGFAALARAESPFYFLAVPVLLWAAPRSAWKLWKECLVVALGAVIVVTPWLIRNEVVAGNGAWLSTRSGVNFYFAHRPNGYGFDSSMFKNVDRIKASHEGMHMAVKYLEHHPFSIFGDAYEGTRKLFSSPTYAAAWGTAQSKHSRLHIYFRAAKIARASWILLFVLTVAGMIVLGFRNRRAASVLGAMVFANWVCFAVIFWAWSRYRYGVDPLLCIAAGCAVAAATERLAPLRRLFPNSTMNAATSSS